MSDLTPDEAKCPHCEGSGFVLMGGGSDGEDCYPGEWAECQCVNRQDD